MGCRDQTISVELKTVSKPAQLRELEGPN